MFRHMSATAFNRISFLVVIFMLVSATSGLAASYKVVFNFNRASSEPSSGLIVDSQGNAYGTTFVGHNGAGSVYELSPSTGYHLLYPFALSGPGGENPQGNLIFDSAGNLYGTTVYGGATSSFCALGYETCGVVFKLTPPSNGTGLWSETVLYTFCSLADCSDGSNPQSGVIMDSAGNLYGTTQGGGNNNCGITSCGDGVVFKLSPPANGEGPWTETVLYTFCPQEGFCEDGAQPYAGLIFDASGDLYGTTNRGGGNQSGEVFELSPSASGWTESVLYSFCSQPSCTDGVFPFGGLTFDTSGNLYGTTSQGGNMSLCSGGGCGTVFELTPSVGGSWTDTILHTFVGGDGALSNAAVVLDAAGNVYGTTTIGGIGAPGCSQGCGTVFRLAHGNWNESVFRFPTEELGAHPKSPVTLDPHNNIYGTTTFGGTFDGVAFKITQ